MNGCKHVGQNGNFKKWLITGEIAQIICILCKDCRATVEFDHPNWKFQELFINL